MFGPRSGRTPPCALVLAAALLMPSCAGDREADSPAPRAKPRGPRSVMPQARPALDQGSALEAVRESIVIVECLDRRRNVVAQGTGVIVAADTVVTAWPLVSRAFAVRVRTFDRATDAEITAVVEEHGLARLKVGVTQPIELGRDTPPLAGATLFAVGAPQGAGLSIAPGVAAGVEGTGPVGVERLRATPLVSPGFAGGALLDSTGALVGILLPGRAGDPVSVAAPVRHVKDLLALPSGSLPKVTSSPLRRLPAPDRAWLIQLMASVAREDRRLTGLALERAHAQLDRLDPLVGPELSWVKLELGLGLLGHRRAFWEDAIEANAFRRAVKSSRRAEWEARLLDMGVLTARDIEDGDRIMRAIAAHEPFDIPGARILADERWLAEMIGRADAARDHIESRVWAARSR